MGGQKAPLLEDSRWMTYGPEPFISIESIPGPGASGYHFHLIGNCSERIWSLISLAISRMTNCLTTSSTILAAMILSMTLTIKGCTGTKHTITGNFKGVTWPGICKRVPEISWSPWKPLLSSLKMSYSLNRNKSLQGKKQEDMWRDVINRPCPKIHIRWLVHLRIYTIYFFTYIHGVLKSLYLAYLISHRSHIGYVTRNKCKTKWKQRTSLFFSIWRTRVKSQMLFGFQGIWTLSCIWDMKPHITKGTHVPHIHPHEGRVRSTM